jgi:hypothetical protein
VPGAFDRAGDVLTVCDADARKLLGGEVRAGVFAELIEDLGPDRMALPIEVKIIKPCSAGGGPVAVGETIRLGERDARLLLELGKGEIVAGPVAPLPAEPVRKGVNHG